MLRLDANMRIAAGRGGGHFGEPRGLPTGNRALLPSVFLAAPMRGYALKPDAMTLAALQKLDFSPSGFSYNADAQIVGRSNP